MTFSSSTTGFQTCQPIEYYFNVFHYTRSQNSHTHHVTSIFVFPTSPSKDDKVSVSLATQRVALRPIMSLTRSSVQKRHNLAPVKGDEVFEEPSHVRDRGAPIDLRWYPNLHSIYVYREQVPPSFDFGTSSLTFTTSIYAIISII